jgi:hypothetical protein
MNAYRVTYIDQDKKLAHVIVNGPSIRYVADFASIDPHNEIIKIELLPYEGLL